MLAHRNGHHDAVRMLIEAGAILEVGVDYGAHLATVTTTS
jgi:hypothetical protein